jgi:hypothetical protein
MEKSTIKNAMLIATIMSLDWLHISIIRTPYILRVWMGIMGHLSLWALRDDMIRSKFYIFECIYILALLLSFNYQTKYRPLVRFTTWAEAALGV